MREAVTLRGAVERETGRWGDDWGRGDKRDLLDGMIRAIDMVIGFPKGFFNGAHNHVLLGVTGGSVSRGVLNDEGGAMLRYEWRYQNQELSARDIAPIHAVWGLSTS